MLILSIQQASKLEMKGANEVVLFSYARDVRRARRGLRLLAVERGAVGKFVKKG